MLSPNDLRAYLVSPSGDAVLLFQDVPRPTANGTAIPGADFLNTIFDDNAAVQITDSANGAVPPFIGAFQPARTLGHIHRPKFAAAPGPWSCSTATTTMSPAT